MIACVFRAKTRFRMYAPVFSPTGLAHNELVLQRHCGGCSIRMFDALKKHFSGALSHLVAGLIHYRGRRIERQCPWHVIITDDRHAVRDTDLPFVKRNEGTERH